MELTAAVLAHTVRSASVVTPPRAAMSRYRHVELISVSERMFLLVLVLQDGSIHQEMLTTRNVLSQSEVEPALEPAERPLPTVPRARYPPYRI